MAEDSSAIVTNLDGAVAVIRFNRPAALNPLSVSTLNDLERTLSELAALETVDAIVLTGSDEVFASGANIRELAQLDTTSALQFSQLGQRVFARIANASQLTIAAISGFCMGGALDLALACDIRVASSNAIFAHPGGRLGVITGWGGTQRLPRIIQRGIALELLLTGRRLTSAEALRVGLVTSVSAHPLDTALSIARQSRH
ncbi:MAG TPA: enoyl-CoA hydratase/isomerase family protein [Pyrinomonadaceae bacterium]|jgi:enoyl-CoA hydratase